LYHQAQIWPTPTTTFRSSARHLGAWIGGDLESRTTLWEAVLPTLGVLFFPFFPWFDEDARILLVVAPKIQEPNPRAEVNRHVKISPPPFARTTSLLPGQIQSVTNQPSIRPHVDPRPIAPSGDESTLWPHPTSMIDAYERLQPPALGVASFVPKHGATRPNSGGGLVRRFALVLRPGRTLRGRIMFPYRFVKPVPSQVPGPLA